EVDEVPSSCDLRTNAPRQGERVELGGGHGSLQDDGYEPNGADFALDRPLDCKKARERPAVVRDKEWRIGGAEGLNHRPAFGHGPGHRLFDVARLARTRAAQRQVRMAPRGG